MSDELRTSKIDRPQPGWASAQRTWSYPQAFAAARALKRRGGPPPDIGIVLGSGLGSVARRVMRAKRIPYESVPSFPRPTVAGHSGVLSAGTWGKTRVALLEGRLHLYEDCSMQEVVFPVRALALWGVKTLLFTCAAGGINRRAVPGGIMIFSDHLNLQGANPLAGPHDERWGERFTDMSRAYDAELRGLARRAATKARLNLFEGVYGAVLGPSYETPAEIRALRRLGADAVGMSTVPEVLAARQLGLRVLAVAIITNRAAGLSRQPLSHEEVLEGGRKASQDLVRFLEAFLPAYTEV